MGWDGINLNFLGEKFSQSQSVSLSTVLYCTDGSFSVLVLFSTVRKVPCATDGFYTFSNSPATGGFILGGRLSSSCDASLIGVAFVGVGDGWMLSRPVKQCF